MKRSKTFSREFKLEVVRLVTERGVVVSQAANTHDITQAYALLHGGETDVFADLGYRVVEKREEIQAKHPWVNWHIAMMPGKRRVKNKSTANMVTRFCAGQPVDVAQATVEHGGAGMSAPANGQRAANGVEIGPQTKFERLELPSFEKSRATTRFSEC